MLTKIKDYLKTKFFSIEDKFQVYNGSVSMITKTDDGWKEVDLGPNKVLLGGLQRLCERLFRKPFAVKIKTFEEDMYADSDINELENIRIVDNVPYIQGYNVGIGGAYETDVVPYEKHMRGYEFDELIPFRVIPEADNNFSEMMIKYAHFRKKTYRDSSGAPHSYIEYFTKRVDVNYTVTTDENNKVPDYPHNNLITDKDIRVLGEFTIQLEPEELREWFALNKKGMESTRYNSIMVMDGKKAEITKNGEKLTTMKDTIVFSRKNHVTVLHGVDGSIILKYKIRMI